MSKKRSTLENYVLLLKHFEKMRNTQFTPKKFIRSIQPFCKTSNVNNKNLFIRVRGSKLGICIRVNKDCFVITQSFFIHEFIFYCDTSKTSSKYLLSKILKHNLLTA